MPCRVVIRPSVAARISQKWKLSDFALVEVNLRLRHELPADHPTLLRRVRQPFDGVVYEFSFVDPEYRLCEHRFIFHVVFSQDEEALIIVNGGYERRSGV